MGSPRSIGSSFSINIASLRDFSDRLLKEAYELIALISPGVNAWAREKSFHLKKTP